MRPRTEHLRVEPWAVVAMAAVQRFGSLERTSGAASKQETEYSDRHSSSDISGRSAASSPSSLKPICRMSTARAGTAVFDR
jgi:hypothetical protein